MTNPTPEQVEAGAKALYEAHVARGDDEWGDLREATREHYRNDFRVALVAAAGAAPQKPTSERCEDCGDKLDYVAGLDGNGCYPHCWRCWYKDHPVEPQAQVDEAKLGSALIAHWADPHQGFNNICRCGERFTHSAELAHHQAQIVGAFLRGDGR